MIYAIFKLSRNVIGIGKKVNKDYFLVIRNFFQSYILITYFLVPPLFFLINKTLSKIIVKINYKG